jgi:D-hydroxyproline dehydrogenase subunit beta
MKSADVAVIGAGIAGLAHAYMAAKQGLKVVVFEREQFAVGASVRNFGLLWPIGQAPGVGLDRALRSREHWLDISAAAGIWMKKNGSLHLAYHPAEVRVLEEFVNLYNKERYEVEWLSPEQVVRHSPGVKKEGLQGGLFSKTECTVYSREAIRQIPAWLAERYDVEFCFGRAVTSIEMPFIEVNKEKWKVDHVFVCSGSDFETLYPDWFQQQSLTKCKLQMMKAASLQPVELGPSLCAGLTLRHYEAFQRCTSLKAVADRYDAENKAFHENGIHVLVAQNAMGELIIGDSHHYGKTVEPFDREDVNALIWRYLSTFYNTNDLVVTERWNGVYPKYKGGIDLILHPEKDVAIVNGLGGAGMTLSFGLAEEVVAKTIGLPANTSRA